MAAEDTMERETAGLKYFSRINYLNKRIVTEEKTFIKHLGNKWNELPFKHKDALIDLLFVDDNIRRGYAATARSTDNCEIQESFPRLFINAGNKINVDFENDLWTWRDEHSGPFSWMSRSQQDLTLSDLEPDNILKPQPKLVRADTEEEKVQNVAEAQFTYPSSSWCHDVVDDFRKNEQNIVLTPSVSENQVNVTAEDLVDEVNPAFQGSCDDLTRAPSPSQEVSPVPVTDDKESVSASDLKSKGKDRSRRSPSPKKIFRSGSYGKSPSKTADRGEQKLISGDEPEMDDRTHAFSNPVMESEWSTFVGHSQAGDSSPSVAQASPDVYAPEPMTMDRGDYHASYSPGGDYSCLLESTDSPAQASSRSVASPDVSEWSTQSTPDHTTHLLKGIQSPVHQKATKTQPAKVTTFDVSYRKNIPLELESDEAEEVLRVEREGDKIVVTTQVENKRDSDIPRTGFDFLDDW